MDRFLEGVQRKTYDEIFEKVMNRDLSPYEAVGFLLNGNFPRAKNQEKK